MATVQDLTAAVGPALLDVVTGDAGRRVLDVSLVATGDPAATAALEADDLVLCATGPDDAALPERLEQWGALGVSAVALPRELTDVPEVLAAAERSGLCLLAVPPGTAWAQLVWMLMGLLDAAPERGTPDATGFGELFILADAVEGMLGGPVTIEDAASRVLAHSAGQLGADPARLSTIVGRRVPAELTERFRSMGVLRALQTSDEPVLVPSWGEGISPRLVLPVRAGRELLGSIWAAVDAPVPPRDAAELQRLVSLVALQLLRRRAHEDLAARLESDRLLAALSGQPPAGWSPPGSGPWRVVCLAEGDDAAPPGSTDRWRAVLRWNGWRTPLLTEADGVTYALVDAGPAGRPGSWAWLARTTTAGRLGASSALGVAAVADPARLVGARVEAAEVTDLLRAVSATRRRAATAEQSWAELAVRRAAEAVGAPSPGSPVHRLLELDRRDGTEYARTLAAALAHPGDPRAAASRLHVHPNTFRYRMRRLAQEVPLDLDDETVRLAVTLQLRAAGAG